jgi:hypothetical protein
MAFQDGEGASVGGFADMPATRSCRLHIDAVRQASFFDQMAENCLGHRRAANVPQADEQYADGFILIELLQKFPPVPGNSPKVCFHKKFYTRRMRIHRNGEFVSKTPDHHVSFVKAHVAFCLFVSILPKYGMVLWVGQHFDA